MATTASRHHGQELLRWLVDYEPQINYPAPPVRPMWSLLNVPYEQQLASRFYAGQTISPDCSEFCTLVFKYSGLQDPTGYSFNGWGNSETMYEHLPHYSDPRHAGALGLIEYKLNGVSKHVNIVYQPDPEGGNPILVNHGSTSGPRFVDFKTFTTIWEPNYEPTFLSIGGL